MTSVKRGNETELGRPLGRFISARSVSLCVSRFSVQRVSSLSKPHFHLFKAGLSSRKFLRSTVTALSTACSKVPTPCPKTFWSFRNVQLKVSMRKERLHHAKNNSGEGGFRYSTDCLYPCSFPVIEFLSVHILICAGSV